MGTPEESFAAISELLLREPGTVAGTGFGTNPGVTVDGKIAVMLVNRRLVVKLPSERCRALIDAREAEPLQIGRRTMREWVSVGPEREPEWLALAQEAVAFVRSGNGAIG